MKPYRLPLKLILLWIANLAVLITLGVLFDLHKIFSLRDAATVYLTAGAVLALLEQNLFDKLRGE